MLDHGAMLCDAQDNRDASLVFSGPVASGISTCLSNAMGKNDVDLIIRFIDQHHGEFVSLDEGAFIHLDDRDDTKALITENYAVIKKLAESVEYQYILNMNYTRIEFE